MKRSTIFGLLATALVVGTAVPSIAMADHHGGDMKKSHHEEKMFDKMDVDDDGVVTKTEFLQKTEEKFNKMDADGDGSVTKEEAEAHYKAMKEKWKEMKEKHESADDSEMAE